MYFSYLPTVLPLSIERSIDSRSAPEGAVCVRDEDVWMNASAFGAKESVADLVQEVSDSGQFDLTQRQRKLFAIGRTNPKLAVALVLRCQQLLPVLPGFCQQNAEAARAFLETIQKSIVAGRELISLASIFQNSGAVDVSLQLLAQCHRTEFDFQSAKDILFLLFIDRRFSQLFGWLQFAFSSPSIAPSVASVDVARFDQCLRSAIVYRRPPYPSPPSLYTAGSGSREMTPKEVTVIPILLLSALLCFMSGMFSQFAEMRGLLAPSVGRFLKENAMFHIVRMFLFASAAFDRIDGLRLPTNRIFALGDENVLFLAYQDCPALGTVAVHPISNLTIAAFGPAAASVQRTVFWNRVAELEGVRLLILCVGTNDIASTLPLYLERDSRIGIASVFELLVGTLCVVIDRIRRQWPAIGIAVHAIFDKDEVDPGITALFNTTLRERLPSDVRFLDVVANAQNMVMLSKPDDPRREKADEYWAALQAIWASFGDRVT
jgi:hypothetical protein